MTVTLFFKYGFSVEEPEGFRTYIYGKVEKYIVVLEPLRNKNEYYLLSAYNLLGKDAQRYQMIKKYKRKLDCNIIKKQKTQSI